MDARSAAAHVNRVVTDVTAPCTLNAHRSDPSCGVNTAPTQPSELRTSWRSARQLENYPFRIAWRSFSGAVVAGFLRARDRRRRTPVGRPQDALKASRRNGGDSGAKATKHNGACNSSDFDAVFTSVPEHARCDVHARARAPSRVLRTCVTRGDGRMRSAFPWQRSDPPPSGWPQWPHEQPPRSRSAATPSDRSPLKPPARSRRAFLGSGRPRPASCSE